MNTIIALIPAKLTSRRLPEKNILPLGGVPLFVHSVRTAKKCHQVSGVYVSTESDTVSRIAAEEGCHIIRRPPELAAPDIPNSCVIEDAVRQISQSERADPDYILVLQPTHPFRNVDEINKAISMMIEEKQATSLITTSRIEKALGETMGKWWKNPSELEPQTRKGQAPKFINRGSFFIIRNSSMLSRNNIYGSNVLAFCLDRPELDIDIDNKWDYEFAVNLLESNVDMTDYLNI